MVQRALLALLAACAVGGCGNQERSSANPETEQNAAPESEKLPADARPTLVLKDFTHDLAQGGNEAAALSSLRSLPAWSAVLERFRLLHRRGQEGIVHGLLVEGDDGLHLVDETEGQGTLSIPLALPERLALTPPLRVVTWGAWQVEDERWIWRATRVEQLVASSEAPAFPPGLVPQQQEPPEDLVVASAVERRGGRISFAILSRGERPGDGWLIADEVGGEAVARILLPGEREPYGDQSLIAEEERWRLIPARPYWLDIHRFRPSGASGVPVYRARSVPFESTAPVVQENTAQLQ